MPLDCERILNFGRMLTCGGALLAAAALLASCNVVGPAAYIIEGPAKVDARYTLADVPTVVYVDDRSNVVNPVSLRRVIAEKVGEVLMVKKLVQHTINPQDAISLTTKRERNSNILSMEEIATMVGAKQLIYVEMDRFDPTPDGFTPRPVASCRVRVIDVEKRMRVFPPVESQAASWPVQSMTREVDPEAFRTTSARLQVFEGLAIKTGEDIAKLFYKHEARELGGNLNPR